MFKSKFLVRALNKEGVSTGRRVEEGLGEEPDLGGVNKRGYV